jgi:hypothetical protein
LHPPLDPDHATLIRTSVFVPSPANVANGDVASTTVVVSVGFDPPVPKLSE